MTRNLSAQISLFSLERQGRSVSDEMRLETAESVYWTGLGKFVTDLGRDGHT